MSELLRILVIVVLVAGNAFFVIAEYATVSARRAVLAERAEGGSRRAAAALRLLDNPVRVISTVQVAITAIGILTGAIGEPLVRELLGDDLPTAVGFLIAFSIVTYLTVVFGELVPKAVSLDRAEVLAAAVARPIEFVGWILRPVVWVFESSSQLVLRPFGVERVVAGHTVRTPAELQALVDEAEHTGVIPRAQEELIHNVFEFASREAADVMVHAPDVSWLDADDPPRVALDRVIESAHTRFPVGEGSLDRLAGVIHAREVLAAASAGEPATIRPLAREAFTIPETKDLGALLRELREQREQLAVVLSEYGTTLGIVTLEDILEEIVGEIESEYELPDARIRRVDARTVEVAGSITVDDFNEEVGTELPQDGPRTLAGLVLDALGRAPEGGERVSIGGVALEVLEVDGARITGLRARVPEPIDGRPD